MATKIKPVSATSALTITAIVICHRNDAQLKAVTHQLSTQNWITEVLLVDTSQNTACKETAIQYKSTYLSKPTKNFDFGKLRNQILSTLSTDWFLFLDSDELLSKQAIQKIPHYLTKTNHTALTLPRYDFFHARQMQYGETWGNKVLRIGKVGKVTYQRNVHEQATVHTEKGSIHFLNAPILHYSHKNISDFIATISWYSKLHSKNIATEKTPILLSQLVLYPVGKFIYTFIFKLGFLDGYRGLCYSVIMSLHSFWSRVHTFESKDL